MTKDLALALVVAATLLVGCAKVVVVRVPDSTPADGVIYALPNTVVRLQVKIDRTERSAARYAPYAAIFAPEGKPVCKDEKCTSEKKVTYSLQQGATFTTFGEPDPANVFLVKFAGRGAIDQTMSMTWNEAGLLSAASSSVTNRTGDVVLSSLKLLAGLGTKAALGASAVVNGVQACADEESSSDSWVISILQKAGEWEPNLIANYCSIARAERDKLPKNSELLTDAVTSYFDKIGKLVSARINILHGSSTSMEPASLLTHIETEIDHQLTALYLGTKKTQTWDGALDVRTIEVGKPLTILHVDPQDGVCISNAEAPPESKPFPDEFAVLSGTACAEARPINLTFEYRPARSNQLFTKITDVTAGDRSFRYRIPAQVVARLSDDKKSYGASTLWVAQLGTVISLPADRHSKMLSYDLAFIEATGALKTFKLGTTGGLDTATVDALSNIGGTLVDYRNAVRKNEDELTILTRQDQLLKLRDDICTIQKKYGLKCTVEPQQ